MHDYRSCLLSSYEKRGIHFRRARATGAECSDIFSRPLALIPINDEMGIGLVVPLNKDIN